MGFLPHQPFKFWLAGLKGRLLPCLGVEHSLQPCSVPSHHQHFISFLPFFDLWNFVFENLPFQLLCLEPLCSLFLLRFWLVMGDIKSAICCVIAS